MAITLKYKSMPLRIESPEKNFEELANKILDANRVANPIKSGKDIIFFNHMVNENRKDYYTLSVNYILLISKHFVEKNTFEKFSLLPYKERTLILGDFYTIFESIHFLIDNIKSNIFKYSSSYLQEYKECGYYELEEFYNSLLKNRVINVLIMNYGSLKNDYASLALNTGCSYVTSPFEVTLGNLSARSKINKYINLNRLIPQKNNYSIQDIKEFILEEPESADVFFSDYVIKPFNSFFYDLTQNYNSMSPDERLSILCDFYSEYVTARSFVDQINTLLVDPQYKSRIGEIEKVSHIDELVELVNIQLKSSNLINVINGDLPTFTNFYRYAIENDDNFYNKHRMKEKLLKFECHKFPLCYFGDQMYFVGLTNLLFSCSSIAGKPLKESNRAFLKASLCYLDVPTSEWTQTIIYYLINPFLNAYANENPDNLTQEQYWCVCCNMYMVYEASSLVIKLVDEYLKDNPEIAPEEIKNNMNYAYFEKIKIRAYNSHYYKAAIDDKENLAKWFDAKYSTIYKDIFEF